MRPTLHFPQELRLREGSPKAVRDALGRWSRIPLSEPPIGEGMLRISGFAPQHPMGLMKARLPPLRSPHGLLFRTEDNISFAIKVLSACCTLTREGSFIPSPSAPRSVRYISVGDAETEDVWTPTIPRLLFSLANYGHRWDYHFSTAFSDLSIARMMGVEVTRARVLLLAIAPRGKPLMLGMDKDELVVKGAVPMRDIFILNDSPRLFRKLLAAESAIWPVPEHAERNILEGFAKLERWGPERKFNKQGM